MPHLPRRKNIDQLTFPISDARLVKNELCSVSLKHTNTGLHEYQRGQAMDLVDADRFDISITKEYDVPTEVVLMCFYCFRTSRPTVISIVEQSS